jgi:hypothetical protein
VELSKSKRSQIHKELVQLFFFSSRISFLPALKRELKGASFPAHAALIHLLKA